MNSFLSKTHYQIVSNMACCACSFFGVVVAIAIIWKLYLKLRLRRNNSFKCLVGKTVIVTGANTGIGYETALDLASRGARVILGCRNKEKAEEATRKIITATNNQNVVYRIIDMTSLESVRRFANEINETEERLDVLVNNAGAGGLENHTTSDGIQITIHVNHVSPFLLTHLLLDKLKKSAPSRIVNVSSIAASLATIDLEKINEYPKDMHPAFADNKMYGVSKLCNIYFTTELAKYLDGSGVTVNALHPGAVLTDIFRRMPPWMKMILMAIAKPYFKTPEEGAQTNIYLAASNDVVNVTGKLFDNCKRIELYDSARDAHLARRLWRKSEELAKLQENEKLL